MTRRTLLAALAALCALLGGTGAAMASTTDRPATCHPTGTIVDTTDPSRDCWIHGTIPEPETTTTTAPQPSTTVEYLGEDGRPPATNPAAEREAEAAARRAQAPTPVRAQPTFTG